jgi:hypothetical protein
MKKVKMLEEENNQCHKHEEGQDYQNHYQHDLQR